MNTQHQAKRAAWWRARAAWWRSHGFPDDAERCDRYADALDKPQPEPEQQEAA